MVEDDLTENFLAGLNEEQIDWAALYTGSGSRLDEVKAKARKRRRKRLCQQGRQQK